MDSLQSMILEFDTLIEEETQNLQCFDMEENKEESRLLTESSLLTSHDKPVKTDKRRKKAAQHFFKCAFCEYQCSDKTNLEKHVRTHVRSHSSVSTATTDVYRREVSFIMRDARPAESLSVLFTLPHHNQSERVVRKTTSLRSFPLGGRCLTDRFRVSCGR
jgi:hypothetical protein